MSEKGDVFSGRSETQMYLLDFDIFNKPTR